jgi:phage shock protein C
MEPTRKLYRSRAHRTIAGVCCGLADYFGVDPTLIRVIFVLLNLLGGAGIVLYLLLWIIVPNEPEGAA